MRWLQNLYNKVLNWSRHPKAPTYLAFVSFVDSSVFPVSPVFMLIPMAFARPEKAFLFATITSISSILGGLMGYILGMMAFEAVMLPFLQWMGYMGLYQSALQWFQQWGFWAILLACFSPIPYKIFTIGAGVLQLPVGLFLVSSGIGRFLRFFLIAIVIRFGGPKMESWIKRFFVNLNTKKLNCKNNE